MRCTLLSPASCLRGSFHTRAIHICAHLGSLIAREDEGSSLVETAVSVSLLLTLVISIMGFSLASYANHYVAFAARQGARYAMVHGSSFAGTSCASAASFSCQATAADVKAYVIANLPPGIVSSRVGVTTTWPGIAASGLACLSLSGNNSPGCDVQVTVTYTFKYNLPFLPKTASTFQSAATLPIAQ